MLTWKSEYETGFSLLDTQHQTLFKYINKLQELTEKPSIDKSEMVGFINFLESYVVNHFNYEETCMERFNCPAHATNQKAHAEFLKVWGQFKDAYARQGPDKALLTKLHSVAMQWIKNHICSVDIKLRANAPIG